MQNDGLIHALSNVVAAYLKRLTDIMHLAGLEAKLAARTLTQIIILLLLSTFLLLATWLSLLMLIFVYLLSLSFTPLFAASALVLINIVCIAIIIISILLMKKNLFFPATRRQLRLTTQHSKEK